MEAFESPENIWWIGLFVAVAALCLALGRAQDNSFLNRIQLHNRKRTTANIPGSSTVAKTRKAVSGSMPYKNVLPPQYRQTFSEALKGKVPQVDEEDVLRNILPMTMDYQACQEDRYTPMGFSVQELRDLGDFPNYTVLSGVPMPQPYHEFDIDKALPRPYRPFRWPYHQTMCMTSTHIEGINKMMIRLIGLWQQYQRWSKIGGSS